MGINYEGKDYSYLVTSKDKDRIGKIRPYFRIRGHTETGKAAEVSILKEVIQSWFININNINKINNRGTQRNNSRLNDDQIPTEDQLNVNGNIFYLIGGEYVHHHEDVSLS